VLIFAARAFRRLGTTALAPSLLAMICQCLGTGKFDSMYLNIIKKSLALVQKADVYLSLYVHVCPSTPVDKTLAIDALLWYVRWAWQ
jgi:hypothetical protein